MARIIDADGNAIEARTAAEHDSHDHTNIPGVGGGDGGVPSYSLVASGLIPNDTDLGTVYTQVAGRLYIVMVSVSAQGGPQFIAGDLSSFVLQHITVGLPKFNVSAKEQSGQTTGKLAHFLTTGTGQWGTAQAASAGQPGDTATVVANNGGTITAAHVDNGNGTNGVYKVFEAS